MTITNHIRGIQADADEVIELVDQRDYGTAHVFLDSIEKRVRLAHEHIDHLQEVNAKISSPAGGS